jgi:plasmid stabilization system protein ParE
MKYSVIVRPEAEADLTQAFRWYEKQSKGLGSALLLSVDAAISGIQRNPELYPKVFKSIRRALLRRFPYGVYYAVHQERISILAIFHAKRNPEQLKKRE